MRHTSSESTFEIAFWSRGSYVSYKDAKESGAVYPMGSSVVGGSGFQDCLEVASAVAECMDGGYAGDIMLHIVKDGVEGDYTFEQALDLGE